MDTLALGLVAVVGTLGLCGLLMWWQDRAHMNAGRRVVVSLTDGTVISGRTAGSWRFGRIRLVEVTTDQGEIPGTVIVFASSVITVQVLA
ncbi:hypothetical protein [uncultured Microbacterium sp.]|uniref:hypothetical protein n=1 Tax=uncultured Microbacterium sp. TaxID=191216 RepID=UPI0025E59264|nr:hypothetical protein [uncultured Microbacterium sp.]